MTKKKKQNAHLSVSGTVPKTQWVTPLRLVSPDCLRQYFLKFFMCFFLILASERCHIFVIYLLRKSYFFVLKTKCVNEHQRIFEIAVRNFLLAEQQAHEQVKKVQIKPSFILKLLTCVSGHSLFFRKMRLKTALNLCSWLFETKRVNEH